MKKYILFIDDDTDELMIFLDAMNKVPGEFKCTYASSPHQAIEILKEVIPDFIFVDYNLPRLNGLQFLSLLKTDDKWKNVPKFLYSNRISDDISKMAKVLGATGCIEKTDTVGLLAVELRTIFQTRQAV
jgi:CheY-like chemotaxis protein